MKRGGHGSPNACALVLFVKRRGNGCRNGAFYPPTSLDEGRGERGGSTQVLCMKGVMGRVVAGSVRETGDVAGDARFCAGNGWCGGWWQVPCTKRVMWQVVPGSVCKTGDVAGGRGFCARNG